MSEKIEYVIRKGTEGQLDPVVHRVLGRHMGNIWVVDPDDLENPYTSLEGDWVAYVPRPETGDVWTIGDNDYRVIGVDEKRDVWHLTQVRNFHDPADYNDFTVQYEKTRHPLVFTRRISYDADPDSANLGGMRLKERPE